METMVRIFERAESMIGEIDRLSVSMDLDFSNVNLEALLGASDETFLHDLVGIMGHMDRERFRLGSGFVPRVGFKA